MDIHLLVQWLPKDRHFSSGSSLEADLRGAQSLGPEQRHAPHEGGAGVAPSWYNV